MRLRLLSDDMRSSAMMNGNISRSARGMSRIFLAFFRKWCLLWITVGAVIMFLTSVPPTEEPCNSTRDEDTAFRGDARNPSVNSQESRQMLLKNGCLTPRQKIGMVDDKHILVDYNQKILYCKVPKSACTSISMFFVQQTGNSGENFDYVYDIHRPKVLNRMGLRYLSAYPKKERLKMKHTWSAFVFVRHPLDRLRSAYADKFIARDKRDQQFYEEYTEAIIKITRKNESQNWQDQPGVSFQEFVQYILHVEENGGDHNEHWQTIERLCEPCRVYYDVVGHIETMDDDITQVKRVIYNQTSPDKISLSHLNKKSKKLDMSVYEQLSADQLWKLKKVYARDFQIFGYDSSIV